MEKKNYNKMLKESQKEISVKIKQCEKYIKKCINLYNATLVSSMFSSILILGRIAIPISSSINFLSLSILCFYQPRQKSLKTQIYKGNYIKLYEMIDTKKMEIINQKDNDIINKENMNFLKQIHKNKISLDYEFF